MDLLNYCTGVPVYEELAESCPLEGTRPVDRPAPAGQQLVDAWRAEHGDEAFPE